MESNPNSKNMSQEYNKFLADKKSLITILYGQYDEATQTKIALGATYTAERNARRLLDLSKCALFVLVVVVVVVTVVYHTGPINKL